MQINNEEVCLIGGNKYSPSLLTHDYDVERSCLLINLTFGVVTEKSQMITGRLWHGIACINNYIYAIAGCNSDWKAVNSCERHDIAANEWCEMPESTFGQFTGGVSTVVS